MKRRFILGGLGLLALGGGSLLRVDQGPPPALPGPSRARPMDLSGFSPAPPASPLRLLFLHHSVGGQLFAPEGPHRETSNSIYVSSPNGGDLRRKLEAEGYEVHEASYGSVVADRTDLFDWPGKFRDQMERILRTDHQDATYTDGRTNRIVMFKSCYPNSELVGPGTAPGNPAGPALTVENAKAALRSLLPLFAAHPDVLFVYVTAPPVAPDFVPERAVAYVAKKLLGRPVRRDQLARSGVYARELDAWVVGTNGWLAGYRGRNVVVFDYYGELADPRSGLSRYPSAPFDSHPSAEGNRRAAALFVPFLNRAVRRAGLSP